MAIHFIPKEIVFLIYADLIRRYGGQPGLRDAGLLDSALAQPKMTAGGKYVHRTLFHKAAAYGFHICRNHPFVDGNKRLAFTLMDIFLQKNGWEITASEREAFAVMMDLATGNLTKLQLSAWLKSHSKRLSLQKTERPSS